MVSIPDDGGKILSTMEPRIQYAQTSDGVSIALWVRGQGVPLLQTPPVPFSQVQLAGQLSEDREWGEVVAGARKLIRYDSRGTGLSGRNVADFSLDALMRDLEAVVAQQELERLVLWGQITSGPVAIAYAASHPERVSHLVLWSSWARSADIFRSSAAHGLVALVDTDWDLFTETAAHAFFGWSAGELAHRAAVFMRENVTPQTAKAMIEALSEYDVTELLPKVQCPTLVFHSSETPLPDVSVAGEMVSRIPNASLVLLEGTAAGWELSAHAERAINEFIGIPLELQAPVRPARAAGPASAVSVSTIFFTDLASSTALTQSLGDAKAQELVRAHNIIVREALGAHGGTEIKHTGDGIMASFPTSGVIECAVAIQRAVVERADVNLQVHIGLNAGEPVAEESDLFGTSVQLARRICDHAEAGQILVSNVVRELAAGKGVLFSDIGEVVPKGFDEPVRLYEVRWREVT